MADKKTKHRYKPGQVPPDRWTVHRAFDSAEFVGHPAVTFPRTADQKFDPDDASSVKDKDDEAAES
jgi:hypothetical protein